MSDKFKQIVAGTLAIVIGVPLAAAFGGAVLLPIVGFWWWLGRCIFSGVCQ